MSNVPRVFRYLRPYWKLAAFSVCLIIFGSRASLLSPWPLKIGIDYALKGDPLPPALAALLGPFGSGRNARYEDIIQSPQRMVTVLMEQLRLDSSAATVQRILQEAPATHAEIQKGLQTSAEPEASIGRWRQHLSPPLQEECRKVFDLLLIEFGYPLDS